MGKNQRDMVRTQERQESDTITRIEQFNIDTNKKVEDMETALKKTSQ